MSLEEEWLSSRLRLCEISPDSEHTTDAKQTPGIIHFNADSCSTPAYTKSSVLGALWEYTHVLCEARDSSSDDQEMETDTRSVQSMARVPGNIIPTYADSLAREILTSMQSQWESTETGDLPLIRNSEISQSGCCPGSIRNAGTWPRHTGNTGWQSPSTGLNSSRDIDMDELAQKITSNVIQAALEKIGRGKSEYLASSQCSIRSSPEGREQYNLQSVAEEFATKMAAELKAECMQEVVSLLSRSLRETSDHTMNEYTEPSKNTDTGYESSCTVRDCSSRQHLSHTISESLEEPANEPYSRPCQWLSSYRRPTSFGSSVSTYSSYVLAQMSLHTRSSIDYPDAPPPTPLVPKKAKNRSSFSRKLKGGLAKEFLPSPPPPTPKDQACSPQEDPDMADKKAEFVDRLIRSLSLECSQREQEKEENTSGLALPGDQSPATERILEDKRALLNYAAQLSLKIINWGYNSLADLKQLSSESLPKSHPTKETSEAREGENPSCHVKIKSTGKDKATKQNRTHWDILQIHANQWAGNVIKESLKIISRHAEEAKSGTHPDNHCILSQESRVVSFSVEGASGCSPLTYNYVPLSETSSDATIIATSHNFCAPQKANLNSLTSQMISDIPLQTVQLLQEPTSDSFKDPVCVIAEQLSKRIVKDSLLSVAESKTAKACGSPVKRSGVHMPELKPRVRQPVVTNGNSPENLDTVAVKNSVQESVKTHVSKQDNSLDSKLQSDTKLPLKMANTQMPAYRAVSHLDSQNDISTQQLVGVLHWITASQMQTSVLEIATTAELLCSQFCSLGSCAVTNGWTVGDLLTSLLQYCEARQHTEARGRSLPISLLEWLQTQLQALR
nr:PREDICTED: uncharacterized protein LOC107077868 [Lepisosteus oculatus]